MAVLSERLWFGRYELRRGERLLLADGEPVPLGSRALDVLSALLERPGRVITKQELLDTVWPDSAVEENNLSVQISALRKALDPDLITTVPGRGYRLTVRPSDEPPARIAGTTSRPSLAVLPFANLGGDPDQEYFADGLTEDIITTLSASPWLLVIARGSSFAYRGSDLDLKAVARALGVRYLVTGSVRRSADKVRIAAQLTECELEESLWSAKFDRALTSLFDIQDEIASRIASAIEPAFLRREERRAARKAPRDLEHWDMLMRARWHYWRSSRKHGQESQRILERALARRPDDVNALSLLAFGYLTDVWSGWADDPKKRIGEALRLATRAVALDDHDSFAHLTLGVAMACIGDHARAIAEQRRALEIQPHFAAALGELGRLLAFAGETREAVTMVMNAMVASPDEPRMSLWLFTLAIAAFIDGDHLLATRHARDALAQRPDWFFNHYLLAACLSANGEIEAARAALATAVEMMPQFDVAALRVGHPFAHPEHRDRYIDALRKAGWKR